MSLKQTIAIALLVALPFVYSCTKDCDQNPAPGTTTPKTKLQLLTHKPWMIQESYELMSNTLTRYERGAAGNDMNYDLDVLHFTSANAGTWTDFMGSTYPFTWSFTNAAQTKMSITVQTGASSFTLNYNSVAISDSSFSYSFNTITPASSQRVLVSARRVWKP